MHLCKGGPLLAETGKTILAKKHFMSLNNYCYAQIQTLYPHTQHS